MTTDIIVTENLSRRFGETIAVDDASFSIGSGEIVGLLGHNGAGKSTVMKLLTGFLGPSTGTAFIKGLDVSANHSEVQRLLGYLPENLPLYTDMSVVDYLEFVAAVRDMPIARRQAAIRDAMAATSLSERALHTIGTLSRGYRQRVGVAQAILHNPDILILDEPTNGLDPEQTQAMRDLLVSLAEHATVILSTHIMQEVDALCSRVLILRAGQLALDAQMADLRSSRRLYVGTQGSRQQIQNVIGKRARVQRSTEKDGIWLEFPSVLTNQQSAEVASLLAQAEIPFHALHPERRDLEQVFRQITTGQA